VTILAFIELIQNSSTFGLIIDVGESVNCLVDPPELGHSLSQLRWSITDLKRSHDRGSLNHTELERSPNFSACSIRFESATRSSYGNSIG